MKFRFLYIIVLFCASNLVAQINLGNYPRTYFPQVFFNSAQAENALQKGTASIKGMAFAVDAVAGERVMARDGTQVLLFPYTDYLDEWLNLTNKNKNNIHSVYLLPEVFEYRRETTTDSYGNYTFSNLKPGKYYIETIVDYNSTALATEQTGTYSFYNMDRYGNMTGGSVPTYDIYSYKYATAKRLFKVVEIDKEGETIKANLKPAAMVPFVDLDVVGAKTSGVKCYEERGTLNGNCITYFPNGAKKVNAEWKKNLYDGDYKEYSDKGTLIAEGKFKKGHKINEWKYYDPVKGMLIVTENHLFKKENSTIEGAVTFFYPSGKIREINNYKNGKMHGEMLGYYESGALKIKGSYVNNFLDGLTTYYSENGEILITEKYVKGELVK